MWRAIVMLSLLWPLTAAAASPVPTELYAEVDHALRPATVLADPLAYQGRTLLLGGLVERTISEAAGVTVEIACWQLDRDDRPEAPAPNCGRLSASGANLDGARLQPGRMVTLVGRVAGLPGSTGGLLPHLEILFIHAWPTAEEEEASRPSTCSPGYCCDPWWCDPWYDPWYWGPYPRWHFGGGYYRHWH